MAFQRDKVEFIRRSASLLNGGETVAFIEPGWNQTAAWTTPTIPIYDEMFGNFLSAIQQFGADPFFGSNLACSYVEAGLVEPSLSAELLVDGPALWLLDFNLMNFEVAFGQVGHRGFDVPSSKDFERMSSEVRRIAISCCVQFSGPAAVGAWAKVG
jgi:hypothetical protein